MSTSGSAKSKPKSKTAFKQKPEQHATASTKLDPKLKELFISTNMARADMQLSAKRKQILCTCCGVPLNEATGVRANKTMFPSGWHPMCLHCQQKYYADISAATSRTYALFYACIAFCVPYKPDVIATMVANQNGVWYEYIKKLQRAYGKEGTYFVPETWQDGIMDIKDAFGGEFPSLPITGDVMVANMNEMSDRERWDIEWGEKMCDEDCRNADDRYMMMTAHRSGGAIPASVSMYLRDAIRYMIQRDKSSDSMEAKRYQEMADKIMNSDSVKNWQANKGETIQVDRVVRYLESIGAMENGYLIGYDELAKVLSAQHGNYNTSLDIVDCMMMCIINTMRKNNGDAELTRLPVSAQVTDFKGELLAEISPEEKKILEGLGMKPPERERVK